MRSSCLSTHDEYLIGENGRGSSDTEVKILVERDKVLEHSKKLNLRGRYVFHGVSPALLNELSATLHKHYQNYPALSAAEVGTFLTNTLGWQRRLEEESGFMDEVNNVISEQSYQDEGRTLLEETLHGRGASKQFAAGLKVLAKKVPLGFKAGGGKLQEDIDGKLVFSDEYTRDFFNALSTIHKGGQFPIPPDMELVLVSSQDLKQQAVQIAVHSKPGGVRVKTLSMSFTTRDVP